MAWMRAAVGCCHAPVACDYRSVFLGLGMRSVLEVHSLCQDKSATANMEHANERPPGVTIPFTTGAWG